MPAGFTVDNQLNMVEKHAMRAEQLREFASAEELEGYDYADATLKPDGSINILKGIKANVAIPVDPEQLRYRIKLHATSWAFVKLK